MKINDYIHVDSDKIYNNKEFKLYYDGYLTEVSNNEPISLRYGDQDWKQMKIVEMEKDENNRLYANLKLNSFDKMNFCFEYNNVWDNNFSNNYSLSINKLNFEDYQDNEDLSEHLSDDFLVSYNLNKKAGIDIPYVTSETEIYESASNINLAETELENLKESLEKLFPEEKVSKARIKDEEENLAGKFADSFVSQPLYDDFVEIEYEPEEELELFRPKQPIRDAMLLKFNHLGETLISNIVLDEYKIVLKSKEPYRAILDEIARKNEVRQIVKLGTEEDAQFLVVSPYSELDIYDDSIVGTIKRYAAYISKSIKKIYYYLRENLGTDNI